MRPEVTHTIQFAKAGYKQATRKITVQAAEQKALIVKMKPSLGVIAFNVMPKDAELIIDGKSYGSISSLSRKQLKLNATHHRVRIRKKGYQDFTTHIVPRPGFPQEIKVTLDRISSPARKSPGIVQAFEGYPLKLITPEAFTMGSSRREQGRRSNETLRRVWLKRSFYMGIREVTNQEFRKFAAAHNSGAVGQLSLSRADQPVVNISWHQAAQYCNWLSVKESLPPAYRMVKGKMIPVEPIGIGYRLPTEAEWEYCARYTLSKASNKYPWGAKFPPRDKAGNFADESAKRLVNAYLKNYNDGHAVTAPVASFKFNPLGLHDMGGNVAEWSHDFYTIYPYSGDKVYIDPTGPKDGRHHVIRGASWKQASISNLRTAHRDYGVEPRADVGFRICRYAQLETSQKNE
jgi:formylglycine-generating enzyme required for sulfatase activity